MYQLGIKTEAYGKCVLIELEWLEEFMGDVRNIAHVLAGISQVGYIESNGIGWYNANKRWVAYHISCLYYGINNYFDEGVSSWSWAVEYMRGRYELLKSCTTEELVGACECAGCKGLVELLKSANSVDYHNEKLIWQFLKDN